MSAKGFTDEAIKKVEAMVSELMHQHGEAIMADWAKHENKAQQTVGIKLTIKGTIRAPHLSVKISYGTKDTDEIAVQMPDPMQPELPIGGKP